MKPFSRTQTTFKALYGQAYRAPNAYEFSYENSTYKSNPGLQPETIRSYELVWEQAVARHYRLTGSLFYNQVRDLITQGVNPDPKDPRFVFRNTDSVTVKGGEVEVEGRWDNGLRARASYGILLQNHAKQTMPKKLIFFSVPGGGSSNANRSAVFSFANTVNPHATNTKSIHGADM